MYRIQKFENKQWVDAYPAITFFFRYQANAVAMHIAERVYEGTKFRVVNGVGAPVSVPLLYV